MEFDSNNNERSMYTSNYDVFFGFDKHINVASFYDNISLKDPLNVDIPIPKIKGEFKLKARRCGRSILNNGYVVYVLYQGGTLRKSHLQLLRYNSKLELVESVVEEVPRIYVGLRTLSINQATDLMWQNSTLVFMRYAPQLSIHQIPLEDAFQIGPATVTQGSKPGSLYYSSQYGDNLRFIEFDIKTQKTRQFYQELQEQTVTGCVSSDSFQAFFLDQYWSITNELLYNTSDKWKKVKLRTSEENRDLNVPDGLDLSKGDDLQRPLPFAWKNDLYFSSHKGILFNYDFERQLAEKVYDFGSPLRSISIHKSEEHPLVIVTFDYTIHTLRN